MGSTALNRLSLIYLFSNRTLLFTLLFGLVQFFPAVSATEVTLQLKWLHQFQFAGYYMAKEKGFYDEVGLDVIIKEREPNVSSLRPLIDGDVQFSVTDPGSVIYYSRGAPILALAAIFQRSPSVLIVREGSGVTELADLKGKKLRNIQGYSNAELLAMFKRAGLSMLDLELVASDLSLQSFINGEFDAMNGYLSNEPYLLDKLDFGYNLFRPSDYGIEFYGDILVTTPKMVNDHPEVVADFLQATLKGWNYAVDNIDETVDLILAKYNSQNKSRDQLINEAEQVVRLILPQIVPVGYMSTERWQNIVSVFRQFGSIEQPVVLDAFLYQPQAEQFGIAELYQHYRLEILIGIVLVITALLALHNRVLRRQVHKSTLALQKARMLAEDDARTDNLTGLPNRRHFTEVLNRDLEHARRHQQELSLVMIDIDDFKQVNDQYGHATGDEVLKQVGRFFRHEMRSGDFCARIGGEEFVLLYRDTSLENARSVTERLRLLFNDTSFSTGAGDINITLSIGLTCLNKDESAERLMSFADAAMYQAKRTGKDRIVVIH